MSEPYLVLFDANKIKDYVFATGRLKEIRGASEQVRQLTDPDAIKRMFEKWFGRELGDWHPGCTEALIYAGGGAGALLVANKADAHTFCTCLEREYRRKTRSGSLSAVCVPVQDDAEAIAQEHAARTLAHRKASRCQAESIPGGGYIRFCDSDRCYPASDKTDPREGDRRESLLSAASKNKRKYSHHYRKSLTETPVWHAFCTLVGNRAGIVRWKYAISIKQDMNTIGEQSHPTGYIAFIHADGDGMGNLIERVVKEHGFEGYHSLSKGLSDAAVQATAMALYEAYPSKDFPKRGRKLPFEVITVGGDDVLLICTADKALDVACRLSEVFTDEINHVLHEQFGIDESGASASVGVVIAHAAHPIVNLALRAAELLKSAKRGRSKSAIKTEGWIDFHIVSTPGLEEMRDIRNKHYAKPNGLSLTNRPYACSAMRKLLEHASTLRQLPGSKRSQFYYACFNAHDRVSATLTVLQTQIRMRGYEQEVFRDALFDLGVATSYPFLKDASNEYTTPLLDLIELAEFVGDERRGTGDRGPGTGDGRPGTGDRGPGTGDRGQKIEEERHDDL